MRLLSLSGAITALLSLGTATAQSLASGGWSTTYTINGNTMTFAVTATTAATTGQWVGISFSPGTASHQSSDMYVGIMSTAGGQVLDTNSGTQALPCYDTTQNILSSKVAVSGTAINMTFTRMLDTGDTTQQNGFSEDLPISTTAICVGWAFGSGATGAGANANYNNHGKTNRGNFNGVNLVGTAATPSPTAAGTTLPPTAAPTTAAPTTPAPTRSPTTPQPTAAGSFKFVSPNQDYSAIWSINQAASTMTMTMSALCGGYVSVSFSPVTSHKNSDMYVGWMDSTGNIMVLDTFSNDLNQPTYDTHQDVSGVTGSLTANALTVTFTRPLIALNASEDMTINNTFLDLGWAYSNVPGTGTGVLASYAYHTMKFRGNQPLNMITGSMTPPPATGGTANSFGSNSYKVSWVISADKLSLTFTMTAMGAGWLSVGFADANLRGHVNNDVYTGWIDSTGKANVVDGFSNSFVQPVSDTQQDATGISGSLVGGLLKVVFTRKADTGDAQDHVIPQTASIAVNFAWGMDTPTGTGNAVKYNPHAYGNPDARSNANINLFTGGVTAAVKPMTPDITLTIIVSAFIGIYALFRFGWKAIKAVRISRNDPVRLVDETDDDVNFEAPVEAYYYRGSVAVPYKEDTNGVVVDDVPNKIVSPSKRFKKVQEKYGTALLTTKDVAKDSGNPLLNLFHKLGHIRIPKTQMSLADALLGTIYLALNFGLALMKYPLGPVVGLVWGYLATANSLFVALPATRNSVLVWLLGVPFDKTIMYHRWIGRLILLQATVHFYYYPLSVRVNYLTGHKWDYGLVAWICLLLIFLTSVDYLRRNHFNTFFNFHFIFILYYITGALHSNLSFVYFSYAAAAFYGLDRIIRLFWGAFPTQTVKLEPISGAVRVVFKKHFAAQYKVGQYVFVNFPQIGFLEWHPFTLASGPDEPYCEVMIKGLGDHTRKLLAAAESNQHLWIRVDGPYGKWPYNFSRFKGVVLVAGGVGVTPSMALIRHVFHINRNSTEVDPYLQDVFFIWSCKNEREFGWYRDMLEEAMARSALENSKYPRLHGYVHITKPEGNEELPGYIKSGRPNLHEIFDRVENCAGGATGADGCRVAVVACGPEVMVSEAWDETNARTKGTTRFDFHHETFEF